MKLLLNGNSGFVNVPEGNQVLKIEKATALPAGKPECIEIVYVAENGGRITSTYRINDEKGIMIFSILVNKVLGNFTEFDTDNLNQLVGKYVLCEITHKTMQSNKDPEKTVTFANIAKILEGRTGYGSQNVAPTNTLDDDLA